jgi:hypothetical protein
MDRSLVIDHHRRTLKAVIDELRGLSFDADAFKTVDYYNRALSRDVLDLWRGDMPRDEFVDDMLRLIEGQFRKAWGEGMRENELDPQKDMTPEWEDILQNAMANELDFVEPYADAIIEADGDEDKYRALQGRVALWTNRYNDIVNLAVITTKPEGRFKWEFGATEQHCATCAALDGIVATGTDWAERNLHPQGAPNPKLECGGWRCDCSLSPTDDPLTEGGIPNV